MEQYHNHLKAILERGTKKPGAREGMPGSISLFGYQNRYNLADGFPLLTTKAIKFKHIITELIWFLKGDTNIKFLVDNGFKMWNQDAYNYYKKKCEEQGLARSISFELFCNYIERASSKEELTKDSEINSSIECPLIPKDYTLGDCGFQYGKVWRDWEGVSLEENILGDLQYTTTSIDQIKKALHRLSTTPEGRRHIVTAMDPAHDEDLALYWCHNMFQFNCRPLTDVERRLYFMTNMQEKAETIHYDNETDWDGLLKEFNVPKYYLDCQLYQRSADMFLGVPFNIASYALLTHIFAKMLNYIPGEFIHTFGDSHIYEDHLQQVDLLLSRTPKQLPTLNINTEFWKTESGVCGEGLLSIDGFLTGLQDENFVRCLYEDIQLSNYNPDSFIAGKLSTGLK